MPNEIKFPGIALVTGGGRILPSPSSFYLTGSDRLRVVSANSKSGVGVDVHWRLADPLGDVIANAIGHTPNSDRSVKTTEHELGVGQLLNLTVFASGGAPRQGQTYVMVQLVRGMGTAAIVLGTLLGGYVTETQALGFPGSPIVSAIEGEGCLRHISGTQPAAGVELFEGVPTGAVWELVSFTCVLTTSAAPANRQPLLALLNTAKTLIQIGSILDQVASTGIRYTWAQGLPLVSKLNTSVNVMGWPVNRSLLAGFTLLTQTNGLQGADQWGIPEYLVRERLEV